MLTPTEERIYSKLCDGQFHSKQELLGELYSDGPGVCRLLSQHIYNLRLKLKWLRPGTAIVSGTIGHGLHYRLVRISPEID